MLAIWVGVGARADDVVTSNNNKVSIARRTDNVQQYWYGWVQRFMSENIKQLGLGPNKATGLYKDECCNEVM